MKLNPDCIRDVLLDLEANTGFRRPKRYIDGKDALLKKYSWEEIMYHIKQASESGLIEVRWYHNPVCDVQDLTAAGHEFLGNVRSSTVWGKVLSTLKSVGVFTVKLMVETAAATVASYASNLNP